MDNKVNINIENSIKVLKLTYENILKMFNEIDQIVSKKNCFGIKIRENSGNLEVKEVKDLIKTRFIYAYVNPKYNVDKNEDIQDFEKNHISYLKDDLSDYELIDVSSEGRNLAREIEAFRQKSSFRRMFKGKIRHIFMVNDKVLVCYENGRI